MHVRYLIFVVLKGFGVFMINDATERINRTVRLMGRSWRWRKKKKALNCLCGRQARYRVRDTLSCGLCLHKILGGYFAKGDKVTVMIVNRKKCMKNPGCNYWQYSCLVDKCVFEK